MHFRLFRYVEHVVIKAKRQRLSSKVDSRSGSRSKEVSVKVKVNIKLEFDLDLCP